jgi:hypothetical protein
MSPLALATSFSTLPTTSSRAASSRERRSAPVQVRVKGWADGPSEERGMCGKELGGKREG